MKKLTICSISDNMKNYGIDKLVAEQKNKERKMKIREVNHRPHNLIRIQGNIFANSDDIEYYESSKTCWVRNYSKIPLTKNPYTYEQYKHKFACLQDDDIIGINSKTIIDIYKLVVHKKCKLYREHIGIEGVSWKWSRVYGLDHQSYNAYKVSLLTDIYNVKIINKKLKYVIPLLSKGNYRFCALLFFGEHYLRHPIGYVFTQLVPKTMIYDFYKRRDYIMDNLKGNMIELLCSL